ncbi:MAG: hypothetical protein MUP47_01875, partial [Phycisphaerae bacterium]|nr:hypothetical protein [Phycisphaerae bacterium]
MKRAIAWALCLLVAPMAWGQTTLEYDFTYIGTYTPTGMTRAVDVYDLTFTVWPGDVGAIVLDVGTDYLGYGGNPFQVGIQLGTCITTPTVYEANSYLATETFARQSDSHFLFPP